MEYGAHSHQPDRPSNVREYAKLIAVIAVVAGGAWVHADWQGMSMLQYMESFMGVFFLVFAAFKLANLKEFAYGLKSYAGYENAPLAVGYLYPFIQVAFGLVYILGFANQFVDGAAFVWSAYGAYVVWKTLRKKGDFHCVCLGNIIKLPLSTTSFVEDFGMAAMALAMLLMR